MSKTTEFKLDSSILLLLLLYSSTNKGDLVVDPVLGSGTTMKVCLALKRRCIGIEINMALKERIIEKLNLI